MSSFVLSVFIRVHLWPNVLFSSGCTPCPKNLRGTQRILLHILSERSPALQNPLRRVPQRSRHEIRRVLRRPLAMTALDEHGAHTRRGAAIDIPPAVAGRASSFEEGSALCIRAQIGPACRLQMS